MADIKGEPSAGSSGAGSSGERSGEESKHVIEFETVRLPVVLHGEKVRFSNFLVLMNTNKFPKSEETARAMADELLRMAEEMFGSVELLGRFVQFGNPEARWSSDYIRRVKTAYAVEMGEHYGKLHVHASIKIVHTTVVRLNLERMQEEANHLLEGTGLTIAYTHISAHGPTPEDYLGKCQL